MTYIYPSTIQITTGRSKEYGTQKLSNKDFVCDSSTNLAYWGDKNPSYEYQTITGKNVEHPYNKPEAFYATNWNVDNLPSDVIIKNITIEYKWEQISYSCSNENCFGDFDKPKITLIIKGKNVYNYTDVVPDTLRYENSINENRKNTNNAELTTLHSKKINISQHNLQIKDLKKNIKIKFDPGQNNNTNNCRIVMQFIRINIDYKNMDFNTPSSEETNILPNFRIVNAKITPSTSILDGNESGVYKYQCTIKSTTPSVKETNCKITCGDDIIIDPATVQFFPDDGNSSFENGIWNIKKFYNYKATLSFEAHSTKIGTKTIDAEILNYADSVQNKARAETYVENKIDKVTVNATLETGQKPYIFDSTNGPVSKRLKITIKRTQNQDREENVIIDTNNWITSSDWQYNSDAHNDASIEYHGNGVWEVSNIDGTDIIIQSNKIVMPPGEYNISIVHNETNKNKIIKNIQAYVTDAKIPTDYFKLRLEDGSDVKYNSLIFAQGDDLTVPLTYNIEEDNFTDNINVYGESKHIPTGEAQYITYTIQSKKEMENVLCNIDVINTETGEKCLDVIIAGDNQVQIFDGDLDKFCAIDQIAANEDKKIKFIVQSDIPKTCIFKLKVLNYDEYDSNKWTPSYIYFQDMPSIKMSIDVSDDDLSLLDNNIVDVFYNLENVSNADGTNLKFKIKEPTSFLIQNIPNTEVKYNLYTENANISEEAYFNERTRILTIPEFPSIYFDEANNENIITKYVLHMQYQVSEKGIFDLVLSSVDDQNTMEDDQWENSITKKIMVDVSNNTFIKTYVDNQRPYLGELIDFTVNLKNYLKEQQNVKIILKDLNDLDQKSFEVVYSTCTKGTFEKRNDSIGIWSIKNLDINEECELILTLRPNNLGYHIISTTFYDSQNQVKEFENTINVLEPNKKIEFDVHHAKKIEEPFDCNCDELTYICDEDYIDIDEDLYYVCEITNNSRNPIDTTTHIYARIDQSFLPILCSSHNIQQDNETNLLHIEIPKIDSCSTIKTCFRVKSSKQGTYIANFTLANRNAHVCNKNLTIHVNKNFKSKKLEHEINIYNFEKTNKYFRYELDGNNTIFKFFNRGNDKSLRLIDTEQYNRNNVETYKGTNLKKIVRDIATKSKYVEPELLRIGSNKFKPKGYELYPDGFIRRFGLLNSEVFHYTGQLPIIKNMSDDAMRWEIDDWNEKVWGGGIYDNGIFGLTIDYGKIPTNFNILELDNPIQNLQALVDKVKPYGTQAICSYSTKIYLDLIINTSLSDFIIDNNIKLPLNIANNIDLLSTYKKHDNNIVSYYDIVCDKLKTDINTNTYIEMQKNNNESDGLKLTTDLEVGLDIFDQQYNKKYISECFDIVQDLYSYNTNVSNVNIIKDFNYVQRRNRGIPNELNIDDIYSFEYDEPNNLNIFINDEEYNIEIVNEPINKFIGFKISNQEKELFNINYNTNIYVYNIQIQLCEYENKKIIHIFSSINEKEYIHMGYIIANINDIITIDANSYKSYLYTQEDTIIKFKIDDTVKTSIEQPKEIIIFDNQKLWQNIENIKEENKYAKIENNKNIDEECQKVNIQSPKIGIKYGNIDLNKYDEITDISFKIEARTNKENFADDININIVKDGDSYIPTNNIGRRNFYPNNIMNINEQYLSDITIQQPNITICSKCMKTALGLYDECPYCGSQYVSQYDEKKAVTICKNPDCGWIYDGWNDFCHHCLSLDVVKTKVDFNKTYCYDHGHLENDYYPVCPKCFSTNIEHLNNDENKYTIRNSNSKNIEPITIKSDINRVNVFNMRINNENFKKSINNIKKIYLHISGQNNNDGKFYYCPKCGNVELNHANKCSSCGNTEITLKEFNNITMDIYYKNNDYIKKLDTDTEYDKLNNQFDIAIDILDLVNSTTSPEFQLLVYIENLLYDDIAIELNKLDVSEKIYELLYKNIQSMNIIVDNIYYEYEYINSHEWEINKLYGKEHTGVKYTPKYEQDTNYIYFSDFNIPKDKYKSIFLNLNGINKAQEHLEMEINVINQDNEVFTQKIGNITPDLFSTKTNLLDFINYNTTKDISVKIKFECTNMLSEIIITECYITTEKEQSKNIPYPNINTLTYDINKIDENIYLINNSALYNLNDEKPYYLDGGQLENNLVCFFDFGKLKNNEYIRLYDIDMIVQYKNKYGQINTDYINTSDDKYTKQLIDMNIQKNNAEFWGEITTPFTILNNLESEIVNSNEYQNLQSVPLTYELSQSFTINSTNISEINLNYDGQIGYPNNIINIEVYDDYENNPGNLIFAKEIIMPNKKGIITINTNLNNIEKGKYWLKIIDHNADKNNYHRFYYNTNLSVGNLIISDGNIDERNEDIVLSFSISTNASIRQYMTVPTTLNLNDISDFRTSLSLYRYNTKSINNIYLSNINIQTGYEYTNQNESDLNE